MAAPLLEKIDARRPGICLYGFAPPKQATSVDRLAAIVAQQEARFASLEVDGLVVYDIQDEADRIAVPRPFPFLPTLSPERYAYEHLGRVAAPKVVYRSVNGDTREGFVRWLGEAGASPEPRISVLVGAPTERARVGLALADAYQLARRYAPRLVLGGIVIAERHARRLDEHERMLAKMQQGCRFFISQAVYDVTSTKSLISDYALAATERGTPPLPVILTFSPCGSAQTLSFMKWLGVTFPRWLDNELRTASDPLTTSLELCVQIFAEAWDYAREKGVPLGANVESVSIRKAEIEASLELLRKLKRQMESAGH